MHVNTRYINTRDLTTTKSIVSVCPSTGLSYDFNNKILNLDCLWTGRPFVVELINPHRVKFSPDDLKAMQKVRGPSGLVLNIMHTCIAMPMKSVCRCLNGLGYCMCSLMHMQENSCTCKISPCFWWMFEFYQRTVNGNNIIICECTAACFHLKLLTTLSEQRRNKKSTTLKLTHTYMYQIKYRVTECWTQLIWHSSVSSWLFFVSSVCDWNDICS